MSTLRWSIATKLALLTIAVGLPLSGILAWSIQALFRSEVTAAEQSAVGITNAIATRAETAVDRTRSLLKEIAKRPAVQAMDRSRCDPLLTELRQFMPQYANINTFNPQWEFVCSAAFPTSGRIVRSDYPELYERMKAADGMVMSAPVRGQLTGKLVVIAAYPVKDAANRLIGAVTAPIDLPVLAPTIAGAALPAHALTRLINGDGYIVTSYPDRERIGKLAGGVAATAISTKSGTSIGFGGDGIERVYAFSPVKGTDWVAFAGLPTASAFADFRRYRNLTLAALLLVLALAGGLALVVARRISHPIRELRQDAEALANGRLAHRSRVATQDEVGQLAAAFNAMAQALDAHDAERKQAAQELRESRQRLDGIVTSAMDAIVSVDEGKRIVMSNPAAERMFGYTAAEFQGQPLDMLMPERFRAEHSAHLAAFGKTGVTSRRAGALSTITGLRKNGEELPIEASISKDESTGRQFFTAILRDITERKEAEVRIVHLNRVYAVLSGIDTLIVRVHERRELFNEACRIAVEAGQFPFAWIGVLDPATQDVTPVAWAGENAEELTRAKSSARADIQGGRGTIGQAIRERRPVFSNDIVAHSFGGPRVKEILRLGFRSQLTLPLFEEQAVVGTLTMYARERNFFDEEELSPLTELARNISFALGNISRQQKLDKLARIRAISSEINAAIIRIHDREALLRETCRIAVEHGRFEVVWGALVDQVKQQIQPVAWAGFSSEMAHDLTWARLGTPGGTLSEVIRTRRPTVRNDIEAEPPASVLRNEAVKKGYRSTVCLPFVVDDSVVAAIVLFAPGVGFFDEEELVLLNEVVGNVSFALDHIEKEKKIIRFSRIRAVMGSINALIVRVGDRDELFRETCRIAVEQGGFRMAWIGIVDRSVMRIVPIATAGKDEERLTAIKGILSSSESAPNTMAARVISEKKAVVSNDSQGDPKVLLGKEHAGSGVCSMAILPLIVSDEALGVIALYSEETGFFDEAELKLLTELAADIAFAIDHIEKQERLDYLAYYDALTGLANRTLFLERVAQYMRAAVSGGRELALFLIDLERFKNINDSLGRPAGDALLKQVAEWMTRSLGDANLLARLDADHFAVVLPEVKQEGDVARLVEKTMAAFLEHPFRLNDATFRIAAKVGVALFPDDGAEAETLFRNAEAALKKAKASGARYLFYTQKMTETVAGKLTLENQLRQALDNEEFVLHYQPKVNLVSGKLTSAEALIRWNDPRTGLVPPGRFIPVLEETGLIFEVGRWALRKAIADYLRWRAAGLPAVRIAVNVSPLQLRHRGFIEEIRQAIGIDANAPAGLELELTESLIMEDVKHSIASLQVIRAMGVTIAIDDFGTGFSSLSYLAKLPVDTLKIDRSFVVEMTVGPEGLALVSTIINLAHSLNHKVVAEGVETEEQSRLLRLLRCDEMQGFLFSKAVPGEIFETRFLAPPRAG